MCELRMYGLCTDIIVIANASHEMTSKTKQQHHFHTHSMTAFLKVNKTISNETHQGAYTNQPTHLPTTSCATPNTNTTQLPKSLFNPEFTTKTHQLLCVK
eukprot:TRINITY_DN15896_c0_g1_i3.p2 TRINITY_DN15896_c0_g1~~TRINITY_DN15896_c0_g1_i3.p2  ORF type:complete len:100 (-),score=3.58 TRINITY_DN15896_c0_g1_i3:466-765(-)